MTYIRASSKTNDVRMTARIYRRGKRIFVRTDSAPRGGTGVRKGCRKSTNINPTRYAVTVPVSPCRGPDKNIRWIYIWWIYQQTLKALNFSIWSRCQKEALNSRDGNAHNLHRSRIDMYMLRYAKYTWDRYHSLHTYGKVIPFLSNRDKQTLIFQRPSYGL